MPSLDQLCSAALARTGSQPAIEFEKRWVSWGQIHHVAEQVGVLLDASGIEAGAKVAFVARNRPSALAALLGLLAQRCSIRMVYPFQSAAALASDIERIAPAVMVADAEDCSNSVTTILQACGVAGIALRDMHATAVRGCERSSRAPGGVGACPQIEVLTSGTTGPPKPFALSYEMVAEHIASFAPLPADRTVQPASLAPTLLMFPVSNISGLYSTLPPLLNGQRIVLLERFTVAGWHDHLLRFRPQASGLPPAGIQMILDTGIPRADLSCLRGIGTGAAPLDPGAHRAFEERYGVPILLAYGATEFGGPVTRMTAELHDIWGSRKFGSVGHALPGVKLRVVDEDTGVILPPGTEGRLEVISPRIGPDWIRTSDIALIDEDGFLFHRGRTDGVIMRGGFKLLPATIEQSLLLHPAIAAAAVVGIEEHRLGQVPAAAIEFRTGVARPSIADIETHLRNHLPSTHIPTAWRLIDELPRTPSMKVDIPAVRRTFEPHDGNTNH